MSIHAVLHHETIYKYDRRVTLSPQIIRLKPAPHCRTPILSYAMKIEPAKHFINWQQDPFSNWLARIVFPDAVTEFKVTVDLVADMAIYNPFDFFIEEASEFVTKFPFVYPENLAEDLRPYRRAGAVEPLFKAYMETIPCIPKQRMVDFLVGINQRLQESVRYLIRMEPGVQTPEETLTKGSGSCRDSAWLLVQILRNLGFAARFVSGYLIQLTPDVKSLDGPSGTDHDFTDLHAWCEVYLPGAGWIGLDPTSGLLAGEGHIPVCATPEPSSAAPISGSMSYATKGEDDELETDFQHHMHVQRLYESPRVTKPYTEEQWQAIDALGHAVDKKLVAGDVRLTMGGEPTFVSIDDMQGEEWNTAAVGPMKQGLANSLIRRLRDRFAPMEKNGGLLTYGQGKWYPGESLPRWAYALYWRGDGKPLLRADLADGLTTPTVDVARALIRGIAERLEVDPNNALPGYEDAFYYLHRERKLPDNVIPEDNKLKDPEERARISRIFERGLGTPRGYALPVQRWQARAWMSERWTFRSGKMFLIPGDSPVGFRLPLEALPWLPPSAYPHLIPYDPFSPREPLPEQADQRRQPFLQAPTTAAEREHRRRERLQKLTQERDQPAPTKRGAYLEGGNVRTALTVEPRDGHLCIFMPPTSALEDYLDLVAAVEDTAVELDVPVRIEGYPPPGDHRINVLKVTPDPGVIEVNIHPAHNWEQLRETTLTVYEEARLSRLGTEKFLIDGRAVGTGGGNHFVVGGATPADSPFLRRPDLLGSLIRYWQNHPALSYFFSGLFIGATSQHPRIDEGQDSQLYEIEIALSQLPKPGAEIPLWLVDRLLRNLLVDVTGNTHRTEISIDKLYSPDGPTGRLGLVEFRAFEMPPHPRMSLTQQLLLRSLIAWFWEKPYTEPLIRWGTQLHDQFLLPHWCWKDFQEVLRDLRGAGFGFKDDWFAPHFEFRFPLHGSVRYGGIELELRHALEPWPVLGEEGTAGGTTRFVDSSLERMQVRVTGIEPARYFVTVGGRRLPLRSTGVKGEYVAGLRYRAWQPASALHPTIGVHTPLIFDLYDAYNRRAVAGCTYHVMHPAGRNYDNFPVNSYEAESRRLTRFSPYGHTPSSYWPAQENPNPEYPNTLDLRRPPM